MWFKNLRVYRLTNQMDLSPEALEQSLGANAFAPCSNLEYSRYGWVPPLGMGGQMLTHTVGPYTMICARKQEKILPAAAINEIVEEKAQTYEAQEARGLSRKERTNLKEEIILTLLPRALTRSKRIFAYFDTRNSLLVIDAASAKGAEEFMDTLRADLGELPVVPLACHGDPCDVMTRWLEGQRAPKGFMLDSEVELQNERDVKNVVRCRHQELESEEITNHLKAGKRVTQLAVVWRDSISFLLDQDFAIKRVRFEDQVQEQAEDADDAASQFDQDFAIMTLQVAQFLGELVDEFGGVQR